MISRRTAQALGLTIPQHVLLQATEVIQLARRGAAISKLCTELWRTADTNADTNPG